MLGAALGNFFGFINFSGGRAATRAESRRAHSSYGCSYSRHKNYVQSTAVVPVSEPNTKYTREAWERGVTGVVRLRVTFHAGGYISDVETVEGLPYGLSEEAVKVAWQKKFIPATENGKPVTVTQEVDYIFSLNDRMAAGL
jgi:TonB family protein